ncbi:MAG UNVERIFIED_CONTAM: hypothetical protein LVT10_00575 [Anaerolineae bacterium]
MEFHIDKHSPIAWKHIADVDWHPESVVASIQRNGKLLVPRGSSMLRVGDTLTIIADPRSHEALERLFVSTPPTPSIDDGFRERWASLASDLLIEGDGLLGDLRMGEVRQYPRPPCLAQGGVQGRMVMQALERVA